MKHSYHLEYLTIDLWEPNRTIASKCSEFAHVLVSDHAFTSTISEASLNFQKDDIPSCDRLITLAQVGHIAISREDYNLFIRECIQEIGSIQPQLNVPDIMKVKIIEVHPSPNHLIEFDSRFPFDIDLVATLDPSWGSALQDIGFQVSSFFNLMRLKTSLRRIMLTRTEVFWDRLFFQTGENPTIPLEVSFRKMTKSLNVVHDCGFLKRLQRVSEKITRELIRNR